MKTVQEIYHYLDRKAPFSLQMDWDNSGLLVGDPAAEVSRVLVVLDITDRVVAEAGDWGAQLIVSHHPLIFQPVKRVTCAPEDLTGRKIWNLIAQRTAAICCSFNWTISPCL